ncbi:hypothetical protein VTK56DRAFT_8181 [Thermocarpiscus australiensis]
MVDPGNRERGLKAAISNPRVSEQAKQHDREMLAEEFGEEVETSGGHTQRRESAKSSSTAASEEIAQPTHQTYKTRRASSGDAGAPSHQMGEEKDRANVIRGLKAALHNPHVSEKAKEADRKKLEEMGETVDY